MVVLDAFLETPELGTNEIARRTGIGASTVSRILATLATGGFVALQRRDGPLPPGQPPHGLRQPRPREAGHAGRRSGPCSRSSPVGPERPRRSRRRPVPTRSRSTSSRPPARSSSVAELGRPSVAHATAAGKVGLAFGTAELPPAPARPLHRPHRSPPVARLEAELDEVRRQGFATAEGEREPDLNAIAAPVFGPDGSLAAIVGVQGPASRFDSAAITEATRMLTAISLAMSHALGFDPELTKESRMSDTGIVRTAFDGSSREMGVELMDWEGWYWPNHFGDAVAEHHAVREHVGVWDESPLRKWDFNGPDALAAADRIFTNDMLGARDRPGALRALLRRERQHGRRRHGLQVRRRRSCWVDHRARLRPRPLPERRRRDRRRDRADHREAAPPPAPGAHARASCSPTSPTRRRRGPRLLPLLARTRSRSGGVPVLGLAHRLLGRARLRGLLRARTTPRSSGRRSRVPARSRTASPRSRRSASSPG